MIEIRKATEADLPRLTEMGRQFYSAAKLDDITPFNESFLLALAHKCLQDQDKAIFVAVRDDRPVGMVLLALLPFTLGPDARFAYEIAWWVDEDERCSGAGLQLFEAIEAWAKSVGATHIQMAALATSNHAAVAGMYLKQGFHLLESAYLRRV